VCTGGFEAITGHIRREFGRSVGMLATRHASLLDLLARDTDPREIQVHVSVIPACARYAAGWTRAGMG